MSIWSPARTLLESFAFCELIKISWTPLFNLERLKAFGKDEMYLSSLSVPQKFSGTLELKNGTFQIPKKIFFFRAFKYESSVLARIDRSDHNVFKLLGVSFFLGLFALYDVYD